MGDYRIDGRVVKGSRVLALACVLTLLHYIGAFMRVPILPLYASAHGTTTTGVGLIMGAHMVVAALSAIPFGLASDRLGRRALLLGGTALSAGTTLLLPLVETPAALMAIYGAAGLGVSAFTPAMMSLVGDVSSPGTVGRGYAWYSTALYAGFGLGPIFGGYVAELWGHRVALVAAGTTIAVRLAIGFWIPRTAAPRGGGQAPRAAFAEIRRNRRVWAGWIATVAGLGPWGAVMTFFPLLAHDRGIPPSEIGLVFGVQSLVSTVTRLPVGWLLDRTGARGPYMVGGLLAAALGTSLIPFLSTGGEYVALGAVQGVVLAMAFVAIGASLSEASTPATRGLAMGGYSTAIFVSIGLASLALGPVIVRCGYAAGFILAGVAGAVGALVSAALWAAPTRAR